MLFEWLVIISLSFLLLVILITISSKKKASAHSQWDSIKEIDSSPAIKLCPLCKSSLKKGENVHSHLYPGKEDSLMHIHGCPYCYHKIKGNSRQRYCPYCKEPLGEEDYVIARVFTKPSKTQVHVIGCTRCRGPRKNS